MDEIAVVMQSTIKQEIEVKEEVQENTESDDEIYWNYNEQFDRRGPEGIVKYEDDEEEVKPPLMVLVKPICGDNDEDENEVKEERNDFDEDHRLVNNPDVKNEEFMLFTGADNHPAGNEYNTQSTLKNCGSDDTFSASTGPTDSPTSDGSYVEAKKNAVTTNQQNLPAAVNTTVRHITTHGIYKCSECEYTTQCLSDLERHCYVHTQKNSECQELEDSTSSEETSQNPTCFDRNDNNYKCSNCYFSTNHKLIFDVHSRRHTEDIICKCLQCCFSTQSEDHVNTHESVQAIYQCSECDFVSNSKKVFSRHSVVHQIERPYRCKQCDFAGKTKHDLNRHSIVHTAERPYKCTQCDFAAKTKDSLNKHLVCHSGERPYRCSECDFATRSKYNLNQHSLVHTEERPYKCTQCDFATKTKHHLIRHSIVHKEEKPYKCTHCNFAAKTQIRLNSHSMMHTDRPFKCTQCDYAAKTKREINMHSAVHAVERPYKCTECDFAFKRKQNLKSHALVHTRPAKKLNAVRYWGYSENDLKLHSVVHTVG